MNKAKEISALYKDIKQQMGKLVSLCHEVEDHAEATEDHAEVTADAYQRGYETAKQEYEDCTKPLDNGKAYQQGLTDAWEAARWLAKNNAGVNFKVFGMHFTNEIVQNISASECIEKIRQYEQEKEGQIQVGDEVFYGNTKGIVIRPEDSDRYASVFTAIGEHITAENKNLTKTGRHFPEIAEVIQKMKEANNG